MSKSLQEWLQEGTDLYDIAVAEYHELEKQLAELQEQMLAKRIEINEVAKIVGKPLMQPPSPTENETTLTQETPHATNGTASTNGTTAQAVEVEVEVVDKGQSAPYTLSSIARALTGKPTRR